MRTLNIYMLCSVYFVEYTLYPNSMIEIAPELCSPMMLNVSVSYLRALHNIVVLKEDKTERRCNRIVPIGKYLIHSHTICFCVFSEGELNPGLA